MDPSYTVVMSSLTRQVIAALLIFCSLSTQALALATLPCSVGEKAPVPSRAGEHHAEAISGHQHHDMMAMDLSVRTDATIMDCCGDLGGCDMAQCLSAASAVDSVLLATSPESAAPDYFLVHKHVLNPTTVLFKPPISL